MTPLHSFGQFVRNAVQSVPLRCVRAGILLSLVALLAWVLLLPKSDTTSADAGDRSPDLRWGAAAAILLQITIYALL